MFSVQTYQSVSDLGVVLWTSQLLLFMVKVRQKINYFFGVVGLLAFTLIATIVILPFIPILWFILKYANKRLDKYNINSEISISDATVYKSLKQSQTKLVSAIERNNDLGIRFSKFLLFRGIGNQFLILGNSMLKVSKMIDRAVSQFDNVPMESNGFELVSENTLWENRTKAYQYWV
jgi:hypothetical protein